MRIARTGARTGMDSRATIILETMTMGIYEELGVRPIINACATLTRLGGSLMPPEVLTAMEEASHRFINLHLLQKRVGETLAELTHNEAAFVATGAAAGITLAVAACMTHDKADAIGRLPDTTGLKNEVIVFKNQRNQYDYAIKQVGATMIIVGDGESCTAQEFEAAITERTGACMWFQGSYCGHGDVPLAQVIEICTRHGVPVLVDAAAQLPPVENLWNFTQMGAACAIFSGGKDLQGPQSSGMILGQRWLIEAIRPIGSPNAGIGRPMKVGKEEMVGLLAAVRRYLSLDHVARQARYERMVGDWGEAFSMLPGVHSERAFPNEAGQPLSRLEVRVDKGARLTHDQLLIALREGTPCIETEGSLGGDSIFINPWQLTDDEATIVERRVVELLS